MEFRAPKRQGISVHLGHNIIHLSLYYILIDYYNSKKLRQKEKTYGELQQYFET